MLSFQGVKHLNVSACLTWQNRKTQISIFDSFILNMFICTSFVILKNIKITRCVCFGLIWTGSYLSGLSDVRSILGEHLIHYGVVIETNFSNSKECVCVCVSWMFVLKTRTKVIFATWFLTIKLTFFYFFYLHQR